MGIRRIRFGFPQFDSADCAEMPVKEKVVKITDGTIYITEAECLEEGVRKVFVSSLREGVFANADGLVGGRF